MYELDFTTETLKGDYIVFHTKSFKTLKELFNYYNTLPKPTNRTIRDMHLTRWVVVRVVNDGEVLTELFCSVKYKSPVQRRFIQDLHIKALETLLENK